MPSPPPLVFPCPHCRRFVAVDPADRAVVRPVGRRPGAPLLVHLPCPACGGRILRTALPPGTPTQSTARK